MPRLAANISTMFGEWEFLDRIGVAADAGFSAVECQWPYDVDAVRLSHELTRHNVYMVLINAPRGNHLKGDVGLAAIPGRQEECRVGIRQAMNYCLETGCSQVHLLSGIVTSDRSETECRSVLIDNVSYASDLLAPHDIKVLLEPINNHDIPGYFLNHIVDTVSVLKEVNRDNAGLQFDLYHAFRMDEDVEESLQSYRNQIAHIQISGCPGRHEPDIGDIHYPPLLQTIDAMGYQGWVGCEYTPQGKTTEGLGWAADYGVLPQ